jgi:hypothetical protein
MANDVLEMIIASKIVDELVGTSIATLTTMLQMGTISPSQR